MPNVRAAPRTQAEIVEDLEVRREKLEREVLDAEARLAPVAAIDHLDGVISDRRAEILRLNEKIEVLKAEIEQLWTDATESIATAKRDWKELEAKQRQALQEHAAEVDRQINARLDAARASEAEAEARLAGIAAREAELQTAATKISADIGRLGTLEFAHAERDRNLRDFENRIEAAAAAQEDTRKKLQARELKVSTDETAVKGRARAVSEREDAAKGMLERAENAKCEASAATLALNALAAETRRARSELETALESYAKKATALAQKEADLTQLDNRLTTKYTQFLALERRVQDEQRRLDQAKDQAAHRG